MLGLALLCFALPASADPFAVVAGARTKSCGVSAPLHEVATLDAAAQRVAAGTPLRDAIKASGYRARNATALAVDGLRSDDDLARAVAKACTQLGHAALRDAGIHRRGTALWLVVAEPIAVPVLDAKKTGAQVLDLVNRARAQPRRCGDRSFGAAPPVRWSAKLENAATLHARDMAARATMSHQGGDGSTPSQRVTRVGYAWLATGENVAAGQPDAATVVKGWIASPGHCANLMSPDFTEMAVAFATNAKSDQGIYWAQVFGAPLGGAAPRRR